MERRFLDFLELAPRSEKPRTRGLTIVREPGISNDALRAALEAYGDYVDLVKIMITSLTLPWKVVEEKVRIYRDYRIDVSIDDPTFTIAYYQGKVEQFLREVRDIGFTHCQVETSTHLADLGVPSPEQAAEDEIKYIALARELGLRVDGEVGQKHEEGDVSRAAGGGLDVEATIEAMKRMLALGCERVYLESAVIRATIGNYGENEEGARQIRRVVEAVGPDNVILEINGSLMPFDTTQCHHLWAVRTFGPEVNMGGSENLFEIPWIEGVRRGILFVKGPSRSSSRFYVKSLARHGGKAAPDWWKEDYPIDPSVMRR
jgi:phosphosulfolactate synthase (CoM biosynthesis protein A)